MAGARPFRFGLQAPADSPTAVRDAVRRCEDGGYSTILFADHLGLVDPFVACTVAATASDSLVVGTHVLNIDFHPVAQLARACASVDIHSEGRFELGLGTGYEPAEYRQARLRFDRGGARVSRVAETIDILRALFAGEEVTYQGTERAVSAHRLEPLPPQGSGLRIMVGGNGDRLLRVAAERADIVGFTGFHHDGQQIDPTHMTAEGLDDRVAHVIAAGTEPELQVLVQQVIVTADARARADELARTWNLGDGSAQTVLECPFLLIGSPSAIADTLRQRRERYGVSYYVFFAHRSDPAVDGVVAELAGT